MNEQSRGYRLNLVRRPLLNFLGVIVLLAGLGLSAWNLQTVTAANTPSRQNPPAASFPMGLDITGSLLEVAGPEGEKLGDELVRLNVAWVRLEFIATDPTNLKNYDRVIGRLQSRGVRILAVLIDPWIYCHTDSYQRDPALFAAWVREVYLKGCGVTGPDSVHQLGFDELTFRYPYIQHWQIWNEPNVCGFLPSDLDACGYNLWRRDEAGGERVGARYGMQKFGALLSTVYAERANKKVKIVTGGILNAYNCSLEYDGNCQSPGPENCYNLVPWEKYGCDAGTNLLINSEAVQRFKRENNRLPFDILGLHPYQPFAWANGYVPPAEYVTQGIERNVRRFVETGYPIWITEWGFNLANDAHQPPICKYPQFAADRKGCEENIAVVMENVVRGINAHPELNITNFFWFNFKDQNQDMLTGLLDSHLKPRPAWFSFQAIAHTGGPISRQQSCQETVGELITRAAGIYSKFKK